MEEKYQNKIVGFIYLFKILVLLFILQVEIICFHFINCMFIIGCV